jgi:hypothetical protein
VPTFPSLRRTPAAGVLLLALAIGVSACGGDDAEASTDPTETAAASATPTPTPTPTAEPLSPFEDRAPVKAARAWAVAKNEAINDKDRSMRAVRPVATDRGLSLTQRLAAGDLDNRYYMPGPDPFTPVNVQVRGNRAKLSVCMLNFGWSVDRKTDKPVNRRKVGPVLLELVRESGRWKFDNGYTGTADCSGVTVAEVEW